MPGDPTTLVTPVELTLALDTIPDAHSRQYRDFLLNPYIQLGHPRSSARMIGVRNIH